MAIVYEKQKITLGFKKDKPEVYRIKPVRQQPVTFEDLLNEVSNSCGEQMLEGMSVTTMEDYDEEETAGQEPEPGGGTEQEGTDPDEGGGGFT